jgi:phosphatidate cytidylyltransferase
VLAHDTEHFLERSAKIQWGLMITVYCISHVPALLLLKIPGYGDATPLLMFYLLLVVQISLTRAKLVSPSKQGLSFG